MAVLRNLAADQLAELEALRAENASLKRNRGSKLSLKVSEKGAVSIYGIRRFPVTFYKTEWEKIIAMQSQLEKFIEENNDRLATKGE